MIDVVHADLIEGTETQDVTQVQNNGVDSNWLLIGGSQEYILDR